MGRRTKIFGLVIAAATATIARRAYRRRVAAWDTNPDKTGGDPLGLPPGEEISVVAADGATLRGVRVGNPSGPTVMMIHGYIECGAFFAPLARALAATHDLVLVDQRGHGRSDRGSAPYTPETLGDDARCWIEGLDLSDATLLGHSMGGVAAMSFAAHHPEIARARVRSLLPMATLAASIRPGPAPTREQIRRGISIGDRLFRLPDLGLFLLLDVWGERPARAALDVTRDAFLATDFDTKVDAALLLTNLDLRPAIEAIAVPTTVIAGSHDGLTPLELNQEIADLIPGASIQVVPTKGHMLMFEAPEAVLEVILAAAPAPVTS